MMIMKLLVMMAVMANHNYGDDDNVGDDSYLLNMDVLSIMSVEQKKEREREMGSGVPLTAESPASSVRLSHSFFPVYLMF